MFYRLFSILLETKKPSGTERERVFDSAHLCLSVLKCERFSATINCKLFTTFYTSCHTLYTWEALWCTSFSFTQAYNEWKLSLFTPTIRMFALNLQIWPLATISTTSGCLRILFFLSLSTLRNAYILAKKVNFNENNAGAITCTSYSFAYRSWTDWGIVKQYRRCIIVSDPAGIKCDNVKIDACAHNGCCTRNENTVKSWTKAATFSQTTSVRHFHTGKCGVWICCWFQKFCWQPGLLPPCFKLVGHTQKKHNFLLQIYIIIVFYSKWAHFSYNIYIIFNFCDANFPPAILDRNTNEMNWLLENLVIICDRVSPEKFIGINGRRK